MRDLDSAARRMSAHLIALLSWYDEDPAWLGRCVESLALLAVDELVALDGPYALYPKEGKRSQSLQYEAISDACAKARILLRPIYHRRWAGNEVEKRNYLFRFAEYVAGPKPGCWYYVADADEYVTAAPSDVKRRLADSPFDVAAVELKEPGHPLGTMVYPTHPKFFRAIHGLQTVGDHFTYTLPDGRRLWGDQKKHRMEPRLDLTDVKVTHESQLRHPDRRKAALDYYEKRDALGVENLPAVRSRLIEP